MTMKEFLNVLECLVVHLESKNEDKEREEFPRADYGAEELPF